MLRKQIQIQVTPVQRELLEAMRDGAIMTIKKDGFGWVGDRSVSPSTQDSLLKKNLILRIDKSKAITTTGNGYVISGEGISILEHLPPLEPKQTDQAVRGPATQKQLEFARDLGLSVSSDLNVDEAHDLIAAKLDHDKPANDLHRSFAQMYGAPYTKFTGKRELFDRIFYRVTRPTHEKELCAWFTYRVYRHLIHGSEQAPISGPDHQLIQDIAEIFANDETVVRSIRRYQGGSLIWFGEWTSPDGVLHRGASDQTIAYQKVAALLREKGAAPEKRQGASVAKNNTNIKPQRSSGCLGLMITMLCLLSTFLILLFAP
jgi:hypothetical protein